MHDTVYLLVILFVLTAALLAQVGMAGYYAYRRQWRRLGRLAVTFVAWLVTTPLVFLFGVGACAAGCPAQPFEFTLAILICTPSIVILFGSFKRSREPSDGAA